MTGVQTCALPIYFENGPAQLRSQILYQIGRRQEWQKLVAKLSKNSDVLSSANSCFESVVPRYGGHAVFDFADMLDLFDHWEERAP